MLAVFVLGCRVDRGKYGNIRGGNIRGCIWRIIAHSRNRFAICDFFLKMCVHYCSATLPNRVEVASICVASLFVARYSERVRACACACACA